MHGWNHVEDHRLKRKASGREKMLAECGGDETGKTPTRTRSHCHLKSKPARKSFLLWLDPAWIIEKKEYDDCHQHEQGRQEHEGKQEQADTEG